MSRHIILSNPVLSIFFFIIFSVTIYSQETRTLTLESTLDIALTNSYRVKKLELGIENQMYKLEAEQAGLKSSVYLTLKAPEIKNVADTKWNSELQQDEIVHQNTQLWQSELTVKQPVILFGFPTDGYVSLNYKVYRYQQLKEDEADDVNFYNRLYFEFDQPFFLPNKLKNNLERAELNLEQRKMEYLSDRMQIVEDITNDYYRLFRIVYRNNLFEDQLKVFDEISKIAANKTAQDSAKKVDLLQIGLEKANLTESYLDNSASMRNEFANLKQKLRIGLGDSLSIDTKVNIDKLIIEPEQAIECAEKYNPWLKWDTRD